MEPAVSTAVSRPLNCEDGYLYLRSISKISFTDVSPGSKADLDGSLCSPVSHTNLPANLFGGLCCYSDQEPNLELEISLPTCARRLCIAVYS